MKIIINPKATPKAYTFGRFSRRKKLFYHSEHHISCFFFCLQSYQNMAKIFFFLIIYLFTHLVNSICLSPYFKKTSVYTSSSHKIIYSNWIINTNVKHKTIKLIDKNIGKNLYDLELHKDSLDTVAKSLFMKEQSDKLDSIKIKNFCSAKDTIKQVKR